MLLEKKQKKTKSEIPSKQEQQKTNPLFLLEKN
jgi:hypothetical protein